jgi:hypothetical protein
VDWVSRQLRAHGRTVLLVVLVGGLAVVQIVRIARGRRARGARDARAAARISKALEGLLQRLSAAGFERDRGESLEALARRLRAPGDRVRGSGGLPGVSPPDLALLDAAELLDRYAALRYGDVGDGASVEAALARWPEPPAP